jgi:Tfp pilus assembly protein PilO
MEKKKGNEMQIFLLMLALVVIMVLAAVNYLYRPLVDERQALRDENYKLNVRYIELYNMSANEEFWKAEINKSREAISEVLGRYSAGNTPEKSIKFVSDMETDLEMRVPNVTFSTSNMLTSVTMPMVHDMGEDSDSYAISYYDVSLLKETLSFNYSGDYDQLKRMADYINAYPERMNMESISVNYDSETNALTGNLILNLYTVTGTDRQYEEPSIEGIRLGEENIFAH